MKEITATFIIPAYIQDDIYLHFLEETLQSILLQTDDCWNAVIIDDNSKNSETETLIKKYIGLDKRFHGIFLDERKTTGICRNIGINWAKENGTSFILFNDADDLSNKNRVKEVTGAFLKNPDIDLLYSSVNIIDEFSSIVEPSKLSPAIQEILNALEGHPPEGNNCWYDFGIRTGYINITSATAVRIELAKKELFPDEVVSEDFHTWFRYAAQGKIGYLNKKLTDYRIPSFVKRQSSSAYVNDFNLNKMRVDMDGFMKALDIVENRGDIERNDRNIIELKFLMRLAQSMEDDGRLDLVYKIFMKCKSRLDRIQDKFSILE